MRWCSRWWGPRLGASIDPVTGDFTWTPTEAQGFATYTFDVVVTDNGTPVLADSETITVTVDEVNVAPIVTNPGDQGSAESDVVSLTVAAADADLPANTLTFSATGLPPGLSINPASGEISGVVLPTAGAGSPYGVAVRATDNGSPVLFDEVTFTWTITDTNRPPVLGAITDPTGDELTAIAFTATATDPDLPPDNLTFSLVGAPAGASIDPVTGDFTWTPTEADGPGLYTFTVRVTDDGVPPLQDQQSVTVTVDEVNVAPVLAGVGDWTVDEQTLLAFTATATDVDLPANALAFSLVGAPTGASIDPVAGDFTWTPTEAQGFATYTFDVVVTDNGTPVLADSETITVTVDEVNVAPVLAGVGDWTVDEQTLLAFTATATDVDLPANALAFSLVGAPTGASIDPVTGDFTWTPTEAQGFATYTFDVVVTDNGTPVLADSETITVTVDEVNVAPVLAGVGDWTVDEQTLLAFTATATDVDLPANALAFSLVGAPTGASIDPVTGDFTWTPTEAQGFATYTFDVVVTDNGTPVLADSETITVTVDEVNVAPIVTNPGGQSDAEGGLVSLLVSGADSDLPANTLMWSASGLPAGLAINPATGEIAGIVDPVAGAGSPYTVTVRLTDDGSPVLFDEVTFTWTITDTNRPPVLGTITDPTGDELTAIAFTATATDPDLPPDNLTFSLVGAPAGASIDPVTGDFTWTPTEADGPGVYTFTVRVTDDGAPVAFDEQTITLSVNEVDVAPTLSPIAPITGSEFSVIGFTATAFDPDLPSMLLFTIEDGAGTVPIGATMTATGVFTWTPTEADGPALYGFDVVVTDNTGLVDRQTVTIDVTEIPTPPTLAPIPSLTIDETATASFTAVATDPDIPSSVTYTLDGGPSGALIDAATGVFTWSPTEADGPGAFVFDVVATDDTSLEDRQPVTISVAEVNVAPTLAPLPDRTSAEGGTVTIPLTATDPDEPANSVGFTVSGQPDGITIVSGTLGGALDFESAAGSPYTVTVTATDDGVPALSDSVTFVWTVLETNRAPVAVDQTVSVDAGIVAVITLAGADPDGDPVTFRIVDPPGTATATLVDDVVTLTVPGDASGIDSFTFVAEDGDLTSAPATVTLVIADDGLPITTPDFYTAGFGETLTVGAPGVLANDADPEGKPMTAVLVQLPGRGTLTLRPDGSFTYVHAGADRVTDSFTYRVSDGVRQTAPVTVTIDITGNQAPIATDDFIDVAEDDISEVPDPRQRQ